MTQTPVSTFSGTVFTDSNDNGLVDGADMGMAGVTVQLLNGQGNPTGLTTTTAANGSYSFTNLTPGTYSARVLLPANPAGAQFSPYGSTTTPQPTGGASTAAQNLLTNGSFETAGANTTALGFAGWTSSINTAATPYGSGPGDGPEIALTNGASAYAIDPRGATNTYAGTVSPDAANPNYLGGSGTHAAFFVDDGAIETLSQTVNLTAGQTYEVGFDLLETTPGQNNPGFFSLSASIGGQTITTAGSTSGTRLTPGVWTHFADLFTPTTTGAVTLTFSYASGVPGSTLTSKDVLVDDVYVVPGQVTANLTTTSEVNPGGYTTPVTLGAGQSVGNESAGIYLPPATITGTVFADVNADGVKGAGDAGMAGRTVNLTTGGVITATTVTDASGNYSFMNQAAGAYTVTVVAPSGNKFSPAGSSTTLLDSTVGSSGTQTVSVINGGTAVVNAGLYVPATIKGTVFTDGNGDGAEQSTETGLAGVTVKLINAGGTVVATTTTAASTGAYSFTGQLPGAYTVQVVPPTGDGVSPKGVSTALTDSTVDAGATQSVTVAAGGTAVVNAGLFVPSTISGTVFLDANADGAQQGGDAGLAGQTVKLVGADGVTVLATTTTGANGGYSFGNVAPGNDTIQVAAPAGDRFSPNGSSATLIDSNVSATGSSPVVVGSGSSRVVNAGVYAPASVSGTVFADSNADGAQQAGDVGIAGQTVTLVAANGATLTTATNAQGGYSFNGLVPGSYSVQASVPAGNSVSPVGTSASLPDSNVSATGAAAVTLVSGGAATVNAGEYAPSTIQGVVFADLNADGAQQAGDAGVAGRTVNLLGPDGTTVIATTTTGANGSYSFTGVKPGVDTVAVMPPAGTRFSPVGVSASLPDSTVSAAGVSTVTVTSGSSNTVNAGLFTPATIVGTVFADQNADGVREPGDSAAAGQTVTLVDASGKTVGTATTAADGGYSFGGLQPGQYSVRVGLPAGDSFSPNGNSATQLDSTVSAAGMQTVTLGSGATATVNAGIVAPSTIDGTVFSDANADGAQQAGDSGLGGQTVNLLANNGALLATTMTAADGHYRFTGVAPGLDTVQVVAGSRAFSPVGASSSLPDSSVDAHGARGVTVTSGSATTVNAGEYAPATVEGTVFTDGNADGVQQPGDTGIAGQVVRLIGADGYSVVASAVTDATGHYSFAGVVPGQYSVQVTPAAGTLFSPGSAASQPVIVAAGADAIVNAGEYQLATVTGVVFADTNGDGAQEGAEPGIAGVTVNLIDGATVLATTTTDAQGGYSFAGVAPGTDTVQVIAPAGEVLSVKGTSATLRDSTVTPDGTQTLAIGSGAALQVNAGLYVPAAITGHAFLDAHASGVDDFGDPAFSGVVVKLYDGAGRFTGQTATTDSLGNYSFAGLVPGAYQVQFAAPTGTAFTREHAGTDRTIDSDADANGRTEVFTLAAGQTDITRNAGLTLTGGYSNGGVVTGSGNLNGGGDSIIIGGSGPNTIEGGSGTNLILGGSGPYAQIQGLGTNDIIYGGPGDDLIQGHAGNEFIAAGVGNQTLVGGGGTNVFIANANSGTITLNGGAFSGIAGGDTFITHGNTQSIYRAGDGVLTIEDYDASAGDTLKVYGYSAPAAVGQANGFQVLYFGPNAAILVRANNTTVSASGAIQGVSFSQATPSAPLSTVAVDAANYLTLTEAGASKALIGPGTAPTITGATAGQHVADSASITPFSGLVIADPAAGQTETVTVTPFAQNGSFSRVGSGSVSNGVYTVTGTPQAVTASLQALVFNPAFHLAAVGQPVTTGFEVKVIDAAGYSRSDSSTSVIATAADIAPTLAGAVANQVATAGAGLHPFAGITIGDPDGGMTETVSVRLSNPAGGVLSNLGNGSYDAAGGVYTTVGTASAVTANLDQVLFTPGAAGTTGFVVQVTDSAGGVVTDATTSVIAAQAAVAIAAPVAAPATIGDGPATVTLTGWNNQVVVGDGNHSIDAGYGNATIVAGNGNDSIVAGGYNNVVTVGTGADTINAGSNASITAAGGSQAITLNGYGNMVFIGGGNPGHSVIAGGLGNSQITTTNGAASITLAGYGNVVTTGGANDSMVDGAGGTRFLVGPTQVGLSGGSETIANFQASSLVDLIHGAGGIATAADAYNALSAVSGGTRLDLGAGGSVTFLGLTPSDLSAANFKIG